MANNARLNEMQRRIEELERKLAATEASRDEFERYIRQQHERIHEHVGGEPNDR